MIKIVGYLFDLGSHSKIYLFFFGSYTEKYKEGQTIQVECVQFVYFVYNLTIYIK